MLDPDAFTFGVLAKSPLPGILLYGPPGTGKTLLVRALAKESNSTMITVSSADIRSRYVSEGEKKIQRLFAFGRKCHSCIIFIDECDSLFGERSRNGNTRGHNNDLTQFLVEMDGINAKDTRRPVVIAATNRPYDLDEGILRRLGRRILVDVPDLSGREHILRILLRDEPLAEDVNLLEIAQSTPDYTGSDLEKLVIEAALRAVSQNHANGSHERRVLTRSHFLWASKVMQPSPKSDSVSKIREFHRKYGSSGWNGSFAHGARIVNHAKTFEKNIRGQNGTSPNSGS